MKRLLAIVATIIVIYTTSAESRFGIAFYDIGQLYDTIPSTFYDDSHYTPTGSRGWDSSRYNKKVEHIAAVIDSLEMPIVALLGVESEEVVRDIVKCSTLDYSYIHRTLDYYDGLDFALLYYGDRLFVDDIRSSYHWLYVAAEIDGSTLDIHLTRRGDKLRSILPPAPDRHPDITVVAGSLSRYDLRRLSLDNPFNGLEQSGYGDRYGSRGWYFANHIATLDSNQIVDCGVYITDWLLTKDRQQPLSTFTNSRYLGGYSKSLPTYIIVGK